MADIHITTAQPADATAILPMVHALATHHGDLPRVTEADLERDLSGGWLYGLIARNADGPVGYSLLTPQAQAQYGLRGLDLHHLFVQRTARGSGVGTALLNAAESLATDHGVASIVIGANSDNEKAHGFYKSQGYDMQQASGKRFRKSLA
ncbi:putative N-acetyltransferase YhbS [Litoreibacter halocynthiae]|uniref:Putative N-acetyltransferase YhbS n=1 Tax=Litoreibacter halocynthiae TaxID=1242689 RepID=A0A4R7LUK5_9RHOB|nr:GNAT family N-acetyltransferase [Litoreibacter halocynthiae]TDT77910.1 putative N-acetyltransferase YhbS [Litoreibacter halocynthiae]